jgi:hypothetical protein
MSLVEFRSSAAPDAHLAVQLERVLSLHDGNILGCDFLIPSGHKFEGTFPRLKP